MAVMVACVVAAVMVVVVVVCVIMVLVCVCVCVCVRARVRVRALAYRGQFGRREGGASAPMRWFGLAHPPQCGLRRAAHGMRRTAPSFEAHALALHHHAPCPFTTGGTTPLSLGR